MRISLHATGFICLASILFVIEPVVGQQPNSRGQSERSGRSNARGRAGEAPLPTIFANVDKDGDGKATRKDFASVRFMRPAMFDAIDSDGDGTITREEINVAARVDSSNPDSKRVRFEGKDWVADLAYAANIVEYKEKKAMHVVGREQSFVYLPIDDFADGTIEVDIAGDIFSGLAFRGQKNGFLAEKVYFRPQNANTDRHQNTVQYSVIGREDGHWSYLRKNDPGKYEAGADIQKGEWFHVRLDIKGETLKVFVNDASDPVLTVDRMLNGDSQGSIGVWGWDSYFANFEYTPTK